MAPEQPDAQERNMCGIVGYIGPQDPGPILLAGLKRVEYRGYDSCGMAMVNGSDPVVVRSLGRVSTLEKLVGGFSNGNKGLASGIAHSRWATHGSPSETNAHPHRDCTGRILVVHNGIIENYRELREDLIRQGHRFTSETDTEVLPHLIESLYTDSLEEAVRQALERLDGMYGVLVISSMDRDKVVAARSGSPLVVGVGAGESYIASDMQALVPYTQDLVVLDDTDIAVVRSDRIEVRNFLGQPVFRSPERIAHLQPGAEVHGFPNFMLKEIFEQPAAIRDTLAQWHPGVDGIELGEAFPFAPERLRSVRNMKLVACGTSFHAALVGKFMLESIARVAVEVDYASESRYRDRPERTADLVVAVTQSGETADTLAAIKHARSEGSAVVTVCNVPRSMAERESDGMLYTRAGPEVAVASTKAFTTQLLVFYVLAMKLAEARGAMSMDDRDRRWRALAELPRSMETVLETSDAIRSLAEAFHSRDHALYFGRGLSYPIALEGALKLKEVSYIHAEGYPAGEMKHGPIALVDRNMPVIAVVPDDAVHAKTLSNIDEVAARHAEVIAVATEGDRSIAERTSRIIHVPRTDPMLSPFLTVVPLQLYAYHSALARGHDVDKPRNLAKSVTVE